MPAQEDDFIELNKIDRYATRVFTLVVTFFSAHHAIASSTLRAELYADLDEPSFKRQFLRDRNLLASLGISITEAPTPDDDTLWTIDEQTTYVQGDTISPQDARVLYVLCHDMVFDQSFPYRDELRVALIKIAQIYQATTIPAPNDTDVQNRKQLAALVAAVSNHEAVEARYTDAHGNTSKRLLAPLGSFGLRDHTYFVASRITREGVLEPDSVRTYRLDRFSHVTAVQPAISYQIPQDFSVHDFERLPFQIGDTVGTARLMVEEEPAREVSRAMATSGTVAHDGLWEVAYSSLASLAAWCVGNNVTPQAPESLVDAWRQVLTQSAQSTPYDPELHNCGRPRHRATRRGRTIPTDALMKVRQLIALASSLTKEGEVITAQQVAEALAVDYEQARRLIMLVTMGSGESYDYLPLVIDDEYNEVFLMEGAQLSVPQLRLTRSETLALSAALDQLGVPDSDPLAQTLAHSYASPTFSADDLAQSLEFPSEDSNPGNLLMCSQAIANGQGLRFLYRPVTTSAISQRNVVPQLVRRSDDSWYLDAFDLMRQDTRVFRIDRMSEIEVVPASVSAPQPEPQHHQRTVIVRFDDPLYLDVFHWEGLEVIRRRDGITIARLPYYGGTWLARHLVACAGTVCVDDQEIAQQMTDLARELAQGRH